MPSSSLELSFPETDRPIDFASIHLSFEEAAVRTDLMKLTTIVIDCWQRTRNFRQAAQASTNSHITYRYYISYSFITCY
jgi:hypothetical protein